MPLWYYYHIGKKNQNFVAPSESKIFLSVPTSSCADHTTFSVDFCGLIG